MSEAPNLELAVGFLKSIVHSCRCPICDKTTGGRLRYTCGHVACPDCAEIAPDCQLCTPPRGSGGLTHDKGLTERVVHIGELLKSFQEAFNIDVFKSKRISDQQKIEKAVFPECIQASNKYYNKRKSILTPRKSRGKENISILPGEVVNSAAIMDMSQDYVQKWLDQHDGDFKAYQPRKPFADLSVNSPKVNTNPVKRQSLTSKENSSTPLRSKKRSYQTALSVIKSQSVLDNYVKETGKSNLSNRTKRLRKEFAKYEKEDRAMVSSLRSAKKNEKDESGIELDDDPIVIDDSESVMDKDKEAWLAVLEAEKNFDDSSGTIAKFTANLKNIEDNQTQIKKTQPVSIFSPNVLNWMNTDSNEIDSHKLKKLHKVPFYKKVTITEPCKLCTLDKSSNEDSVVDKNISITVETSSIVTKITVNKYDMDSPKNIKLSSQAIQTDLCSDQSENITKEPTNNLDSEDLFTAEQNDLNKINVDYNETKKEIIQAENDVLRDTEPTVFNTHSVHKQAQLNNLGSEKNILANKQDITEQKFVDDCERLSNIENGIQKETNAVIIDTSSDSEHELSGTITVKALVHRSYDESCSQSILREMSLDEIRVPKAVKRGRTPASSDSSDKENRDPNAKRRRKHEKKSQKNEKKSRKKPYHKLS